MTCKDCVHFELCAYTYLPENAEKCLDFKDILSCVSVIRCKDCKWYKESKKLAPIKFCYRLKDHNGEPIGYNYSDNDFCSRGERRTT